jgi:hypothetical protein
MPRENHVLSAIVQVKTKVGGRFHNVSEVQNSEVSSLETSEKDVLCVVK